MEGRPTSRSSVGSGGAGSQETLRRKFFNSKRRFQHRFMQALGQAAASEDSEYEARKAATLAVEAMLQSTKADLQRLLESVKGMCQGASNFSKNYSALEGADAQIGTAIQQLGGPVLSNLETKLMTAIEGIDNKIAPFQELQRRMDRRATLKVDFDAYSHKVKHLKERNDEASIEKLQKTEIKLIHARTALYDATQDLYMTFGYYEELGSFLMAPEIEMVKQGLKAFFESSHQVMSGMQALDPIFLGVEVERKGQSAAARLTLERPSMSMPSGARAIGTAPKGSPRVGTAPPPLAESSKQTSEKFSRMFAAAAELDSNGPHSDLMSLAQPLTAQVVFDYMPQDANELQLFAGEYLVVTHQDPSGWWFGQKVFEDGTVATGVFPGNYVNVLAESAAL